MRSNNSEWKENFRLSQPTSRLFLAAFCFSLSRQRSNKQLVKGSVSRGFAVLGQFCAKITTFEALIINKMLL